LTGSAQIAHCLILLYLATNNISYLSPALALNSFVRQTINFGDNKDTFGGVKGSFPIHGEYGPYRYLNWAAKFMIDSNIAEVDSNAGLRGQIIKN
jgi:hypothetical protein